MGNKKVLVLLGPNLNMVGVREKGVYGDETAESINLQIMEEAKKHNYECEIFQSNWEGALIDKIHGAKGVYDGVVIAPVCAGQIAGFGKQSYFLALSALESLM